MQKMIVHIAESLENFREAEHWETEHYVRLHEFLADHEKKVIFFWNDFEELKLRVSDLEPPQFYDQGITAQDYQVAFFMKKDQ